MEKDFRAHLQESLHGQSFHLIDVPDDVKGGFKKGLTQAAATKKVYDMGLLKDGRYYGIELKWTKTGTWNFGELADHQERNLLQVVAEGGVGLIIIQYHIPKPGDRLVKNWEKLHGPFINRDVCNRAYVVPIQHFVHDRVTSGLTSYALLDMAVTKVELPQDDNPLPNYKWGWDFLTIHKALLAV